VEVRTAVERVLEARRFLPSCVEAEDVCWGDFVRLSMTSASHFHTFHNYTELWLNTLLTWCLGPAGFPHFVVILCTDSVLSEFLEVQMFV